MSSAAKIAAGSLPTGPFLTLVCCPAHWRGSPSAGSEGSGLDGCEQAIQVVYEFHRGGWREC